MATHITVDIAAVAELAARLRALAGSGRDVVFDVIGLATLGLSRAFGAAARVKDGEHRSGCRCEHCCHQRG